MHHLPPPAAVRSPADPQIPVELTGFVFRERPQEQQVFWPSGRAVSFFRGLVLPSFSIQFSSSGKKGRSINILRSVTVTLLLLFRFFLLVYILGHFFNLS